MSEITNTSNTGNQQFNDYDLGKIFIGGNRFRKDEYINNSGYDPISIKQGTVMGRIASSGVLVPWDKNATDGSQYPVGLMAQDVEVDAGDTITATICDGGDVAQEKVVCWIPGQNLNSIVEDRRLKDRLQGDTYGIKLVETNELTGPDNS